MSSSLQECFQQAIHDLNVLPKGVELPEKTKLRLYGLFSYVTKGPELPKISLDKLIHNKTEALKRKAWKEALKLTRIQAMEEYCEIVKELRKENQRPITLSGMLYRKDNKEGWKKCYFELKERVLYYYDEDNNNNNNNNIKNGYPSGVLFLMDGCVVSSSSDQNDKQNQFYVFSIAHPKSHKVFTLACKGKDDAQKWMDAIRSESTRKSIGSNSNTTLIISNNNDVVIPEIYLDSFKNTQFLPPLKSSQDFGVPLAFSFMVDECVSNFLNLITDASLWSFSHEKLNVRTFIQKCETFPGIGIEASKSLVGIIGDSTRIDAPARCVFDLVWNMGERRNVDPQLESWSVVEELGLQTKVDHIVYSAVWPTSKRDFCRLSHYRVDEKDGSILVVGVSVDHLMCPATRDSVRAKLYCTGFLIVPLSETTCRVKYLIVVDPIISSVPRRFVISVATSQTSILEKMQSYFLANDYLTSGGIIKGSIKNIALSSPNIIKRRKKRSTATTFSSVVVVPSNSNTAATAITPAIGTNTTQYFKTNNNNNNNESLLREQKVKIVFDDDHSEKWWLKLWFITVTCVLLTSNLEPSALNLLAIALGIWAIMIASTNKRGFVHGYFSIPASADRKFIAIYLQNALNECPSMNGTFTWFGRWKPTKKARIAILNDFKCGPDAVVYFENNNNNNQEEIKEGQQQNDGEYTALFIASAIVYDHIQWTEKPVLFSAFADRLVVSVDRRCCQDFSKFFEITVSLLGKRFGQQQISGGQLLQRNNSHMSPQNMNPISFHSD